MGDCLGKVRGRGARESVKFEEGSEGKGRVERKKESCGIGILSEKVSNEDRIIEARPLLHAAAASSSSHRGSIRIFSLLYWAPNGRTEIIPRRLAVANQPVERGERRGEDKRRRTWARELLVRAGSADEEREREREGRGGRTMHSLRRRVLSVDLDLPSIASYSLLDVEA